MSTNLSKFDISSNLDTNLVLPSGTPADLTASKYNGGQLFKKLEPSDFPTEVKNLFFVDWFEVTMRPGSNKIPINWLEMGDSFSLDEGYIVFQLTLPNGTRHYQRGFNIWIDGFDFGQILVAPRNPKILQGSPVQFKIYNNVLYEKQWIDRFTQLRSAMEYDVASYTRVDIAIDGYNYLDIWEKVLSEEIKRVGRPVKINPYLIDGEKLRLTGVDIGSKTSDKRVTVYEKGLRIETDNKKYIKEAWRENGLDNLEDVQRIELKMKSKCISGMPEFKYQFLDDPVFLASICRTQFTRFYEFVDMNEYVSSGKNASRVDRIDFIDWEKAKGVLLEKKTTKPVSEVYRAKLGCKSDYEMYYLSGNGAFLEMAEERAAWHSLEDWLESRKQRWHDLFDWRKRQRAKGKLRN